MGQDEIDSRFRCLADEYGPKCRQDASAGLTAMADERADRRLQGLPETTLGLHHREAIPRETSQRIALLAMLAWEDGPWPPASLIDAANDMQSGMTHVALSRRIRTAARRLMPNRAA